MGKCTNRHLFPSGGLYYIRSLFRSGLLFIINTVSKYQENLQQGAGRLVPNPYLFVFEASGLERAERAGSDGKR